jgi:hypothetical protein
VHDAEKGLGHEMALPTEIEDDLVQYLQMMESRLFGLAKSEVCKLAFELAEKNNLSNSFNSVTKTAGSNWFKSFMRRHSQLSLRVPEPTSAARASAFNKPIVTKFFETLSELLEKKRNTTRTHV